LALATAATMLLLLMTLADWMPLTLVILLLVLANLAFGLIMPNAVERAMQPLPQIFGAVGAATAFRWRWVLRPADWLSCSMTATRLSQ
jgi:DHA1 family bicyclomycin/chloramphenicol resistance-like MFS transporter